MEKNTHSAWMVDGMHKGRKNRIHHYIIFMFAFVYPFALAQSKGSENEFLYGFLEGTYKVIGKVPDSNQTYTGKAILRKDGDQLEVIRKIKNKEIKGIGKIETATADKIKVLRLRFHENEKDYEVTYIIDSDLDNYARLSGYIYLQKGGTIMPGLEALFIDHKH